MYQIAIKRADHYVVLNNHIIYCDKEVALTVLKNVSGNTILGSGEHVMLEYSPFKVYKLEGNKLLRIEESSAKKLVNITTKKEKV